jgi:serine acetyltransferase
VVAKTDVIPSSGDLEPGLYLSDRGHVMLGVRSIGAGTIIHDHVTIGRGRGNQDKPEIGRRVWIGPHCVVYGNFRIGDGATLLPNTVLSRSAPAGIVLQGNPATVVRRDFDNSALRQTLATDDATLRALIARG